jgi:MSHA biogenesis protein MshK
MVKSLKNIVGKWTVLGSVILSTLIFTHNVTAQSLSDPTRPPASLRGAQEGNQQSVTSGPILQSVLVSPERKVAVISGQTVSLGEKYGDARVVKITESEVVLSGSTGVQTLKLFPGVVKNVASNRRHPQADSRRQ